jgi:hypothetical protein
VPKPVTKAYIEGTDDLFKQLVVWIDRNRDGISQADEIYPVSRYLDRIYLGDVAVGQKDAHGNQYLRQGFADFVGGQREPIYDVWVVTQ